MIPSGHEWRQVTHVPTNGDRWFLYVCDECGSTYQISYYPSYKPCREREEASPASETDS